MEAKNDNIPSIEEVMAMSEAETLKYASQELSLLLTGEVFAAALNEADEKEPEGGALIWQETAALYPAYTERITEIGKICAKAHEVFNGYSREAMITMGKMYRFFFRELPDEEEQRMVLGLILLGRQGEVRTEEQRKQTTQVAHEMVGKLLSLEQPLTNQLIAEKLLIGQL